MNPLPQMIESILPMRALCFVRGMAQRIRSVVQAEVRPVQADFRMPVLYSRGAVLGGLAVLLGAGSVGAALTVHDSLNRYSLYGRKGIQIDDRATTATGGWVGSDKIISLAGYNVVNGRVTTQRLWLKGNPQDSLKSYVDVRGSLVQEMSTSKAYFDSVVNVNDSTLIGQESKMQRGLYTSGGPLIFKQDWINNNSFEGSVFSNNSTSTYWSPTAIAGVHWNSVQPHNTTSFSFPDTTLSIGSLNISSNASYFQEKTWKCLDNFTQGVGVVPDPNCLNDSILLPGSYGDLTLTYGERLYLTEGVYTFKSISIANGQNGKPTMLLALQPNGLRTVVLVQGSIAIGNAPANLRTIVAPAAAVDFTTLKSKKYGVDADSGQFAGGTMMIYGAGADVTLSNYMDLWATFVLPNNTVKLAQSFNLYGQIFADSIHVFNDFKGTDGAFIPYYPKPPVVTVKNFDATVVEGDPGDPQKYAKFLLTMDHVNGIGVKVFYHTKITGTGIGFAAEGNDFTKILGDSLVIGPIKLYDTIRVPITADYDWEPDETFQVILDSSRYGTLGLAHADSVGIGTIIDNDPPPMFKFANVLDSASESVAKPTITVLLNKPQTQTLKVNVVVKSGTATGNGIDYTFKDTTLTFVAGDISKSLGYFAVIDDHRYEPTETVVFALRNPVNGKLDTTGTADTVHTQRILDNDPRPTVKLVDTSVVEGNAGVRKTVWTRIVLIDSLTGNVITSADSVSGFDIPFVYFTTSRTAKAGGSDTDYVTARRLSGIVSVPDTLKSGQWTKSLALTVRGDNFLENNEYFNVSIDTFSNVARGTKLDTSSAVTILDDDARPAIRVMTDSVIEPDLNQTDTLYFPIQLVDSATGAPLTSANAPKTTIKYSWNTSNGTAVAPGDYIAVGSTNRTLAPGVLVDTLKVVVNGDNRYEGREYLTVTLVPVDSIASAATTTHTLSAQGIIIDNETMPYVCVADTSVTEQDVNALSAVRVFLSNVSTCASVLDAATQAPELSVKFNWGTTQATAKTGLDFVGVTQSATVDSVARLTVSKNLSVTIVGDDTYEPTENFTVNLGSLVNGQSGRLVATDMIKDDDVPPTISSITSLDSAEGNSSSKWWHFKVKMSAKSEVPAVFTWNTVGMSYTDGTAATSGEDYTAVSSTTVTIPVGSDSAFLDVEVKGDLKYEKDEVFSVLATPVSGISGGAVSAFGKINNDDNAPTIASITGVALTEGNSGTKIFAFKLELSAPSGLVSTITWNTIAGATSLDSAKATEDFAAETNQTITIPVGSDSAFLNVTVKGDTKFEKDESFRVIAVSGTGLTSSSVSAVGTILNDDSVPEIRILDASDVTEPADSGISANATFKIVLSAKTGVPVVVKWTTADSSAHAIYKDYTASGTPVSGDTVLFDQDGDTAKSVTVPVLGDNLDEPKESFRAIITGATNAKRVDDSALAHIVDNDAAPAIHVDPITVTEPLTGSTKVDVRVWLDRVSGLPVTFRWSTRNGTATFGTNDYDSTGQASYTIPAGTTSTSGTSSITLPVYVLADSVANEGTETFRVALGNVVNASGTDTSDVVSIVDQTPKPNLSIASSDTVDEANVGVPFTITLDRPSATPIKVLVKTVAVTATSGADYVAINDTITIPALTKTFSGTVTIKDDNRYEDSIETFNVVLDTAWGTFDPNGKSIVIGIRDNEPVPTLSIRDTTILEPAGYGTPKTARFFVTLSGPSERVIGVDWTTDTAKAATHPASSNLDYAASSSSLTFPADTVKKFIDVTVLGDSLYEYDETYLVRLSNPTVATIAKDTGIGVITDNDTMPKLYIDDPDTVAESGTVVFTARLERPSAKAVTFVWNTRNGTAKSDSDYVAVVGKSETIPAMSPSIALSVVTKADAIAGEGVEDFFVKLTNLVEAGVGDTLGRGFISDLTGIPGISIDSVGSFYEPKNDSLVVFHVKLSTPSAVAVTVSFATVSGTATVGTDLADTSGVLTFPIGVTSLDLPVRIVADAFHEEASENFTVKLDNASGAGIPQPTGLGIILDEDAAPTISVFDDTILEPAVAGAVDSVVLVVRLSAPSNLQTTVAIAADDSTAVSPDDYLKSGRTLVFAPGVTEIVFKTAVLGDSLDEEDEWFVANLFSPSNAVLGDSAARVLIQDNDTAPVLSLSNVSANEGDTAIVTVTLARKSAKDVVFDWRTVEGTALGNIDYKTLSGTDTIKAGSTTLVLRVPVFADSVANEFNETFRILVTRAVAATLPDSDAVVTIIDQTPKPQIKVLTAGNVVEDPTFLVFPIKLDRPSAVPVRVRWRSLEGSAKAGLDFQDTTGVLTIAAGSVLDSVKVRVLEDALYEPWIESLQVVLSQPESAAIAIDRAPGGIIDDNDAPPVAIDSAKPVVEGGSALVPVRLLNVSADTVFVYWHTVDGSAKAPADYVKASGKLVFLPGETKLNVSVVSVIDSIWEPTENLWVRIDSVKGGFVADGEDSLGMISLLEEGPFPTIAFDMNDTSVIEGKAGKVPVKVKLSRAASIPLEIGILVDKASVATRGLDFQLESLHGDTLSIPALATSAVFRTNVVDDSLDEIDELVRLAFQTLGRPTVQGKSTLDITILDDDDPPEILFDVDSQTVDEDVGEVVVTGTLTRPSGKPIDVWYSVKGTATAGGVDHDLKPFHIHFDAGSKNASVRFNVIDDVIDEPDETVVVDLDSSVNANLKAPTRQIVLIRDNDGNPQAHFADTLKTVVENVGTVGFPIYLDHSSWQDVVVRISVRGSAILDSLRKGSDAVLDSDVVYEIRIPAGDTTANFSIRVIDDGRVEQTENVILSMVGGTGADTKFTSTSRLVILDNDAYPDVKITRPADSLRTKDSLQTIRWTWDKVAQPDKDTVLKEGWNRISRCATDTAGNTGCDTVHVWGDFTPPKVVITKPDSIHLTNKPGVQVCWTVTDSGATWKRVTTPCLDTTLTEGTHTIVRTACDSVGNCSSDQVIVRVDLTPPTGKFLYPPDSAHVRVLDQPARIRWIDDKDTIYVLDTLHMAHYGWNTFTATYTDKAGNVGTTSVSVYYEAPKVQDGWYVDTDGDGKVDAAIVEFDSPWESDTLPTFTLELGSETRTDVAAKGWYTEGTRGVPAVDSKGKVVVDTKGDTIYLAPGIAMTDKNGKPVIDSATGKVVTSPVGEVYRDASGKVVYNADGLEMYRVPGPGTKDYTRMVVPLATPFKYGVTSVSAGDSGSMKVTLSVVDSTGKTVASTFKATFPLADSVAPIISKAEVVRTESYTGKDSVYITPSEPIKLDSAGTWVEVKIDGVWHVVPAESLTVLKDGRIVILVEPGEDGSVRPGLEVRFGTGVSDTLGNSKAPSETKWATKVEGDPRPPLLELELPNPVKTVPAEEVNKTRDGGFVIRATNKDSESGYEWWKPGSGYTNSSDPDIREVCPDLRYCNGVEVYVNRPVRLFLFVYDLSGTFVINDEINITQEDIDGLKSDKLDRVRIQLQWNMRGKDGQVVGTGVYLWRIVSYVMDPDRRTPIMTNQVVRIGVKSPLR